MNSKCAEILEQNLSFYGVFERNNTGVNETTRAKCLPIFNRSSRFHLLCSFIYLKHKTLYVNSKTQKVNDNMVVTFYVFFMSVTCYVPRDYVFVVHDFLVSHGFSGATKASSLIIVITFLNYFFTRFFCTFCLMFFVSLFRIFSIHRKHWWAIFYSSVRVMFVMYWTCVLCVFVEI